MSSLTDKLEKKIKDKKARIGIMGMGYVGIPLGLEFAGTGFSVTGFDKDSNRVKEINSGKQVMKHIPWFVAWILALVFAFLCRKNMPRPQSRH